MVNYVPERSDVVWLNFDPQQGKEIQKIRPALVISPRVYNIKTKLAIFVPITSHIKDYPFEVAINLKDIKGVALCDQVRSLDWKVRKAKKIDEVNKQVMQQVLDKLYLIIGY